MFPGRQNTYAESVSKLSHVCSVLTYCDDFSIAGELDELLIRPNPCSRQTLEHFVYDFFLSRIGNRMLAEVHLAALYSSAVRLRSESRKIDMFGRLLGVFDAIPQVQLLTESTQFTVMMCVYFGTTMSSFAGR
jgi:hypothetical protein